jgi:hypothetical protein
MNPEDPILPPDEPEPIQEVDEFDETGDAGAEQIEVEEIAKLDPIAPAPQPVLASDLDEDDDEEDEEDDDTADLPEPAAVAVTGAVEAPSRPAASPAPRPSVRPDLIDRREPLYRECRGYRLRLDPPDLARLRELAGSRGKSDDELGEAFFDGQAERLAASIADDVPSPSEIRVVVDPYSRQAFLALENRIRGILSF